MLGGVRRPMQRLCAATTKLFVMWLAVWLPAVLSQATQSAEISVTGGGTVIVGSSGVLTVGDTSPTVFS